MKKPRKKPSFINVLGALTAAGTVSVGSMVVSGQKADFRTYQEMQAYAEIMTYEHQLEGSPEYSIKGNVSDILESMEKRFSEREMPDAELKPLGKRRAEYLKKRNELLNR